MQNFEDASSHDNILDLTPYENFIFALKSSETRRQYPKLLKIFLDFIDVDKSKPIEERADILYKISIFFFLYFPATIYIDEARAADSAAQYVVQISLLYLWDD